jgi:hypothetical protein
MDGQLHRIIYRLHRLGPTGPQLPGLPHPVVVEGARYGALLAGLQPLIAVMSDQ